MQDLPVSSSSHTARVRPTLVSSLVVVVFPIALALLSTLTACAGRAPAGQQGGEVERRVPQSILDDEARIDAALVVASDDSAACPDRCRSASAVCEASERICSIVGELRDASLTPRCDRARGACGEARERVSGCGCAADPH